MYRVYILFFFLCTT